MNSKTVTVDAVLFDMDGTLIDSTPGVLKAWKTFCEDYALGSDFEAVAHACHGRRLSETLREICGITEESKLQEEIVRFEREVINGGPAVLPGVLGLLHQLSSNESGPHPKWTIVTSATDVYAQPALESCGMPLPRAGIVTSTHPSVKLGKPAPDPYLVGAQMCQCDPDKCLVVEDAISGLKSGRAAGAATLAVCTSTPRNVIQSSDACPDYIVTDLTKVSVRFINGALQLTIDET